MSVAGHSIVEAIASIGAKLPVDVVEQMATYARHINQQMFDPGSPMPFPMRDIEVLLWHLSMIGSRTSPT